MADDQEVPDLGVLVNNLVDGLFDPQMLTRLQLAMRNAHAEGATVAHGAQMQASQSYLSGLKDLGNEGVDKARKYLAVFLAHLVGHLLGVEVPPEALSEPARHGGDSVVGRALGETFLSVLRPESGELTPGDAGAVRLIGVLTQFALNTWFESTILEEAISWIPLVGHAEELGKLGQQLVQAVGIDEMGRLAFRPLGSITVATPLTWQANKTYRPALLSEGAALRAFIAGDWSQEQLREELSRQGWSEDRMNVLLSQQYKNPSLEDMLTLERAGVATRPETLALLQRDGYTAETATQLAIAAETKRQNALDDNLLPALQAAYVNREISDGEFQTLLPPNVFTADELSNYLRDAKTRRTLNVRHMSQGEVIAAVEQNILPTAFYREWLVREGYPDDEAFALELLLRARIDQARTVEQHRREMEAERAAAKAAAEKEKADKLAKAEADRALARRGSLADLRRAAVRGLIPFARVEEVLAPQYDADFISTYIDLAEADRVEYLRQQQAREDAEKRAANRRIDVGTLEQAYLTNVIDLGRFRQSLRDRGIVDEDADILTSTLQVRKQDLDDAKAKRAAAELAAKIKHIDLSKFESLVRRGARSLSDYDALLQQLGFEDASRAAMRELLQLQIDDDAKARKAREDAAAALRNKGVSLETERRAAILGLASVDDYSRFLFAQGFGSDAVALLLQELERDQADAQAARDRRAEDDAAHLHPQLPIAEIRRAARLGVIDVGTYQTRLEADGYSADDIEIELTLLTQEIADVQAARQKQESVDKTVTAGLTLAQLAAAVRAGVRPLADYQAAASANPALSRADVDTLVRVLADELASSTAARARRSALASTVLPKDVSIGALEQQVRAGTLSVPGYIQALEQAGLDDVDIDLLSTLLLDEFDASTWP